MTCDATCGVDMSYHLWCWHVMPLVDMWCHLRCWHVMPLVVLTCSVARGVDMWCHLWCRHCNLLHLNQKHWYTGYLVNNYKYSIAIFKLNFIMFIVITEKSANYCHWIYSHLWYFLITFYLNLPLSTIQYWLTSHFDDWSCFVISWLSNSFNGLKYNKRKSKTFQQACKHYVHHT